ncbi:uncharacterized protein LOC117319852, partial [Pecten maximus]|uniref:uncharacterized protein LOC117319852 n=1 Tax=Pecten maximus TaxID=6579 RepID=UPI0014590B05
MGVYGGGWPVVLLVVCVLKRKTNPPVPEYDQLLHALARRWLANSVRLTGDRGADQQPAQQREGDKREPQPRTKGQRGLEDRQQNRATREGGQRSQTSNRATTERGDGIRPAPRNKVKGDRGAAATATRKGAEEQKPATSPKGGRGGRGDHLPSTSQQRRLLNHHGNLRLKQGILESAEDLLKEALDCVTSCGNLATRATILYNLGTLRAEQFEFLLGESCLRQSLLIREQWYGRTHPLVADILYALAGIMGNPKNIRGYDKVAAETVYRRSLEIRESCLGTTHLLVSDILIELAKLIQEESSQGAKGESVKLLQRALDIKTTHL